MKSLKNRLSDWKEDIKLSKFGANIFNKTALYYGLYNIKIRNLKESLSKLRSGSVEDVVEPLKKTIDLYEKLPDIPKSIINYFFSDRIESFKNSLEKIELFGKPLIDIANSYMKNLNYETLIEFENINYLKFLFTEWETYLFNSYKYILLKHPNLLDNMQISYKDLRDNFPGSEPELVTEYFAEKKLKEVFYENYYKIFDFGKKKLGLKHQITNEEIKILEAAKAIRNLYVHSDGTVTSLFLKTVQATGIKLTNFQEKGLEIGKKCPLGNKMIFALQNFMFALVKEIDKPLIKAYPELLDYEFKLPSN